MHAAKGKNPTTDLTQEFRLVFSLSFSINSRLGSGGISLVTDNPLGMSRVSDDLSLTRTWLTRGTDSGLSLLSGIHPGLQNLSELHCYARARVRTRMPAISANSVSSVTHSSARHYPVLLRDIVKAGTLWSAGK